MGRRAAAAKTVPVPAPVAAPAWIRPNAAGPVYNSMAFGCLGS
jgi:hypothetical protein